jgi:bifunctional non-homologous end joining protein LigD
MPKWHDDPAKIRPMLASTESAPLEQAGWVYEPKYDGIRALVDLAPGAPAAKRGAATPPRVVIYSRNGNDKTKQFPAVAGALARMADRIGVPVVVDGEIVAIDRDGRPLGFQALQDRMHLTSPSDIAAAEARQPAAIVFFDLLREGDEDLRRLPLAARRLRLQARVKPTPALRRLVRVSEIVADDGRDLMARAVREGWEGLIAKDGHSTYLTGRRTPSWRKLKLLHEQEFVIGGWTDPKGARTHFGALLLGYYERGRLRFAGSVGTGCDQRELERLAALFAKRTRAASPFDGPVAAAGRPAWLKPDLVAMVRFAEWTSDNRLRQPVYLGLRDDKKATDVVREDTGGQPASSSEKPAPTEDTRNPHGRGAMPAVRAASAPKSRGGRSSSASGDLVAQLRDLEDAREDGELRLPDGDTLRVTNLAKVFWPDLDITKGDLLRYYAEVAPLILPVVDDRPLVMKRFPNGVAKSAFYQQRHPEDVPRGVRLERLPDDVEPIGEDGPRDRLIGGGLKTLLYMTQIAAISQDPWFSRVASPFDQDHAAIDLDPGDGVPFATVVDVACWVKDELDRLGIPGVPKTSGSRGLHIYVPLPPHASYETGQLLCQLVATIVSEAHPKAATVERMVKKRPRGTVYVDYLQNILGKTLATAYSARASDYAGVSTPLTWDEVGPRLDPRAFTVMTAPARFRQVGDRWAPLRTAKAVDIDAVLRRANPAASRRNRHIWRRGKK